LHVGGTLTPKTWPRGRGRLPFLATLFLPARHSCRLWIVGRPSSRPSFTQGMCLICCGPTGSWVLSLPSEASSCRSRLALYPGSRLSGTEILRVTHLLPLAFFFWNMPAALAFFHTLSSRLPVLHRVRHVAGSRDSRLGAWHPDVGAAEVSHRVSRASSDARRGPGCVVGVGADGHSRQ